MKKGLSVFLLQIHQGRIVIGIAFGTAQRKQAGVLHAQDGNNCLEKELGSNVRCFINDNNIGSSASGSLRQMS
ncbi:MAG: hypothetical protein K2Q45_06760 [Nitrosomonas sp.]|nr:hypothetical protein [Nitrosomonas sp.]